MARFEFYINDKERADLINYVLSKGTSMVPDILYKVPEYTELRDTAEFFNCLGEKNIGFFLIDRSFKIEPLVVSKNRYFDEPRYSIYQRKGGPYIDASFYLGYADDATIPYKCSVLDYYERFIHYDNYEEFKAPNELKDYYGELVRFIKNMCQKVEVGKRKFWVSKEVLNMIG